jgi:hypothetical protein
MLPIFWISYHYSDDLKRSRSFKQKYQHLSKTLPGQIHCLDVYQSSASPKNFRGNGIPSPKEHMIINAHNEIIKRAIASKYTEVLIIEDKTSFINQSEFKHFLINFKQPIDNNWSVLFLGGYIEDHQLPLENQEWISGKSRSHFAYIINLKNLTSHYPLPLDTNLGNYLYVLNNTYYRQPFLIIPQYYNYDKGLMMITAKGMSMAQIEENSDLSELKLKMNWIDDQDLPHITLLTIVNNSRNWWSLISMNLNNIEYPTQKMEWIILDLTPNPLDTIEDILPKKRGKEGGWHLKYIKKPEWNNNFSFTDLVNKLHDQISNQYVIEFHPNTFYPTFSIQSRIKTALKYPSYNHFGSNQLQIYNIPKDCTYTIGNHYNTEFIEGTQLICLRRNLNDINNNINNKMNIPGQFIGRLITYVDRMDQMEYKGNDKFPDYLEHEQFFPDLVLIIDDLRKEYQKRGMI